MGDEGQLGMDSRNGAMNGFVELVEARSLAKLVEVAFDEQTDPYAVINLLRDAPESDQYLKVEVDLPRLDPGEMGLLFARTRIFFNVERSKQLWGDAMVALAVLALTQSAPIAFFVTSARKLYDNLRVLTEDEAEVVRDIVVLAYGDPYRTPIKEDSLRSRFAGTSVPLDDILDGLERKGVLAKHRGDRLSLVF